MGMAPAGEWAPGTLVSMVVVGGTGSLAGVRGGTVDLKDGVARFFLRT